jgi:hypothetical protein
MEPKADYLRWSINLNLYPDWQGVRERDKTQPNQYQKPEVSSLFFRQQNHGGISWATSCHKLKSDEMDKFTEK